MDARTVMAKSACIWSGRFSISFTSVRTISGLFMSFGGHDSLIARKVSSTPILDGLFLLLSNIEPRLTKRKYVVRAPAIFFRLNLVRRSKHSQKRYYRYASHVWDFHAAM
jgi:hypothetical protein